MSNFVSPRQKANPFFSELVKVHVQPSKGCDVGWTLQKNRVLVHNLARAGPLLYLE